MSFYKKRLVVSMSKKTDRKEETISIDPKVIKEIMKAKEAVLKELAYR